MGRFSIKRRGSVRTDDGEELPVNANDERQASIASVSASAASSMNRRSSRAPSFNIAQPSAYRQTSVGNNPSAYPSSPLVLMTPPLLSKKNSTKERSSHTDDPQLFDGFDGVHIQDREKVEEEPSKIEHVQDQFEAFADDTSSYHRNDSFVRYEPEHINTQAVAALAQTHVHTVQSPYIQHHVSISGHVVDDIDQDDEDEDDDEVYVQKVMDHSLVQEEPEIELPRQPVLETPAAESTNDLQNLRDNTSLEAMDDEQPHHSGELGLNEDEIALEYELEPEEAPMELARRDSSLEDDDEFVNGHHAHDDDDDEDDDEFTDAQMELKTHGSEDEDIEEITKDEFDNQPTLYHPKPQRAVSHSNLEEEVANDAELREFSLQNKEPSAATISAVGGSPVVVSSSQSADELTNIRKHQKSKSFSFAPPVVPRPRSALKPRPTSAIEINIDHDSLTDIDLNVPVREMTVQEKRASRIAEKHNRRASVASMRSMMSNTRRSVLEPRPTSTIMSPPPEEQAVYYPAPIPVQLALPPLLSKRNKAKQQGKMEQVNPLHFNPQRASSILPPPTWHTSDRASVMSMGQPYPLNARQSVYSSFTVNENTGETPYDEFASSFSRSASPALSMDSGRATVESDMDDNDLDLLNLGDRKPLPPPSPKKKKKKRSTRARSIFGSKKLADLDDDISDDGIDPDEMAEEQDAAMKNIDHLAFTDYNPAVVAAKTASMLAFGSDGFIPGPGAAPTSLIEELEMRKAGRKARAQQVAKESRMDNTMLEDNRRLSRHPLDMRASRSLMQLQQIANRDYDDQVAFQQVNRLTRANIHVEVPHNYTPSVHQDDNPNESLTERRERLKAAKKLAQEQAVADQETLGQRRARLKREKEERQRQSQLVAV